MGNPEINPELRRIARFLPRRMVHPWSVPGEYRSCAERLGIVVAAPKAAISRAYFDSSCAALRGALEVVG